MEPFTAINAQTFEKDCYAFEKSKTRANPSCKESLKRLTQNYNTSSVTKSGNFLINEKRCLFLKTDKALIFNGTAEYESLLFL